MTAFAQLTGARHETSGKVYLVGAGPGDPELLTLKAARPDLAEATPSFMTAWCPLKFLSWRRRRRSRINVGKQPKQHPVPQTEINDIAGAAGGGPECCRTAEGRRPLHFWARIEEALAIRDVGLRCEVVPGITAAQGCAAAAGIPLTHRGLATGVRSSPAIAGTMAIDLNWEGLADPETTLVVYMGAANIAEISQRLMQAGCLRRHLFWRSITEQPPANAEFAPILARSVASLKRPNLKALSCSSLERVSLYQSEQICPLMREIITAYPVHQEARVHA